MPDQVALAPRRPALAVLRAALDWLLCPGWRWPRTLHLTLDAIPASPHAFADLLPEDSAPRALDLELTGALVLPRTHALPTKARAQAARMLELQLKALPGRDAFLGGAKRTGSQKGTDTYLQLVARRSDIEALTQMAEVQGLRVARIFAAQGPVRVLLLDRRREVNRDAHLWWALSGALALVALGIMSVSVWRERLAAGAALEAARTELAALQTQAGERLAAREAAQAQGAALAADATRFAQDADPVQRLLDLTNALPERAWLSSFTLEADTVWIAGSTAGSGQDLVKTLEVLPWVGRVDLLQPFTVDPMEETTNFEIGLVVKEAVR